jgi:hypothetical protein
MRTKLIAAVVTISLTLVIGWYVVAQETLPFGPLPLFTPNSVLTAQQLNAIVERINAIIAVVENNLDDAPQEIVVNCPTNSLAAALINADDGDTIRISGTCTEPVTIFEDGLTLDGQGSTILDGGSAGQPVITVEGAHGVRILNLTARNGLSGILARRGASVTVEGVTAEDNADHGIRIDENSTAHLINCTAQRNGDDGVFVFRNSSATFEGTINSSNNGGDETSLTNDGIAIVSNSSAFFNSGAVVTTNNNISRGITISLSSSAFFFFGATATASSNGTDGIGVFQSSSLFIVGSLATTTTSNNGNRGIEVSGTSTLSVNSSIVNATGNADDGIGIFGSSRLVATNGSLILSENNADGLEVGNASSVFVESDSTMTLHNNSGRGAIVFDTSTISLNGTTTVQGNDNFGVIVSRSSSIDMRGIANILDNVDAGLLVQESSAARIEGAVTIANNIAGSTIAGNGIHVIRTSVIQVAAVGNVQIRNNAQHGVDIQQLSNGRLLNAAVITNNTVDGLHVVENSAILATGANITGNGGEGIDADDSTANVSGSAITGNRTDVRAAFGSRLTLNSNTIGTIICEPTVLSRGTTVCP